MRSVDNSLKEMQNKQFKTLVKFQKAMEQNTIPVNDVYYENEQEFKQRLRSFYFDMDARMLSKSQILLLCKWQNRYRPVAQHTFFINLTQFM